MKNADEYKREMGQRLIMEGCKLLGWQMAIPDVADDEEVPGLVCGNDEWMSQYVDVVPEEGEIEIDLDAKGVTQ